MNEIFTRNRLVTCRTRCARIISLIPSKRCSAKIASVNTDISRSVSIHVFSSLLPLDSSPLERRSNKLSKGWSRGERKNGKHRMVGNVARWNVSHPGEERGEGLGRKDQHSRCNPVSHRLVIPSHTCSPSHHLLRPFSGSCSPAFHRPLRHPFLVFHLCYGTRKSIFVYLFIYFPSSYEDTKTKAGKKVQFPNERRSACVKDRSLSSRMKNIFLSTIV